MGYFHWGQQRLAFVKTLIYTLDFTRPEQTVATSKPTAVDGQFVSLNKESNRGLFRMKNGSKIRYHFTGEDAGHMHSDFAHRGPVRVECIATFDSNLELKGIDITSVSRLQGSLLEGNGDPTEVSGESEI